MQMKVRSALFVVALRRPFTVLMLESGRKKGRLGLIRIRREQIEVAETPRTVGVAARELGALEEKQRAVIRGTETREEAWGDEIGGCCRALLPRERLWDRFVCEPEHSRSEGREAVLGNEIGLETVDQVLDEVPTHRHADCLQAGARSCVLDPR